MGVKELEDRPILRSGEILEAVPGIIITQHAGGGNPRRPHLGLIPFPIPENPGLSTSKLSDSWGSPQN